MNIRRGDVVLADLPYSDRTGSKKKATGTGRAVRSQQPTPGRRDPGDDYHRDGTDRQRADATVHPNQDSRGTTIGAAARFRREVRASHYTPSPFPWPDDRPASAGSHGRDRPMLEEVARPDVKTLQPSGLIPAPVPETERGAGANRGRSSPRVAIWRLTAPPRTRSAVSTPPSGG